MAKITFRQDAIDDLNAIWNYTYEKWPENQADKYYDQIRSDCGTIGENPSIGKKYSEVKLDLLGLKSGKHIIFYKLISEDTIEIIRILHARMDLKSRFRK